MGTSRTYHQSQWHLSMQHLSWWHLSISGISLLLLNRFGPNFESRFVGQSLTDANFQGDICPGNNALATIVHISNISAITAQILTKNFGLNCLGFFFVHHIVWTKLLLTQNIFWTQKCFGPNFCLTKFSFDLWFFWT